MAGLPTTFIRLAGCPLRCTWCDTPYSFPKGVMRDVSELVQIVQDNGHPYVCLTGGEPLSQKGVYPLMTEICDLGFVVSLETSGAIPIERVDPRVRVILDIKCPESGMSHKNHWPNLSRIKQGDEVKFVLNSRADYEYAKEICRQYALFEKPYALLFSPVFGVLDPKDLVRWILEERIPVRLNLQIHKWIWSPSQRGV